ncbi:MAG: cell division protein SepF [Acidimicrobiales bacterium]
MTTMWKKAMLYLGLGPDDEYDDYDYDYDYDERPAAPVGRYAPPEPPEAHGGAVRPLPRERPAPPEPPVAVPTARSAVVRPLTAAPASSRPFAVSPVSFNDAQEVADKFMANTPVILNLEGVDRELSRRLVDFASGLCYGMRGQMEKVTTSVYLLTPTNVEVSAEERRKLQHGGR